MLIGGVMKIGIDILFAARISTMRWDFILGARSY